MNNTTHRTGRPLLLILLAVVVLLAGSADAGWFNKKQDNSRKMPTKHRFTRSAARTFTRGVLHQEARGEWMLDQRAIKLTENCVISGPAGEKAALASGRTAIVTGTVAGDLILVTGVRLLPPKWSTVPTLKTEGTKTPSEANSAVGVIKDVPM